VNNWKERYIEACKIRKQEREVREKDYNDEEENDDEVLTDVLGKEQLGPGYWKGFLKRNKHRLVSKKGQKYALDRKDWSTYRNMYKMYNEIYAEMTEAGVAVELEEPIWVDKDGNEVNQQSQAVGRKITHRIIHPDYTLHADEVGGDTSQKGDGHVGGVKFLTAPDTIPTTGTADNDNHFTTMCFTAGNGKPVMCVVIMTGVQQKTEHEIGIDILADMVGTIDDPDYYDNNIGPGKRFPGGPTCEFRGKKVPCMVRWSKKGGITSEILTDCLRTMDELELFPRIDGLRPFFIVDGHGSRLELPFLNYINDPEHEWCVCLGVPYGTCCEKLLPIVITSPPQFCRLSTSPRVWPGRAWQQSYRIMTMYQACASLPSPPVSDDEDAGGNDV